MSNKADNGGVAAGSISDSLVLTNPSIKQIVIPSLNALHQINSIDLELKHPLPYLWASRICFELLNDESKNKQIEIISNESDQYILIDLTECAKKTDDTTKNIFLYTKNSYQASDDYEELTHILKYCAELPDLDKERITKYNFVINRKINNKSYTYFEKASQGIFPTRFFNRKIDKVTKAPIEKIKPILSKCSFINIEEHYSCDGSP